MGVYFQPADIQNAKTQNLEIAGQFSSNENQSLGRLNDVPRNTFARSVDAVLAGNSIF